MGAWIKSLRETKSMYAFTINTQSSGENASDHHNYKAGVVTEIPDGQGYRTWGQIGGKGPCARGVTRHSRADWIMAAETRLSFRGT